MAGSKKLGKGLNAIFGEGLDDVLNTIDAPTTSSGSQELAVSEIRANPYQPRKIFEDDKIHELANSIKEHGVFQPILVRKSLSGYELIAGERRLRASKIAGKATIPAIIVEFDDQKMMEVSLLENIQRENLSAIEEAEAYHNLLTKLGYTQVQLAERIGKSRAQVANMLRLLKLPTEVRALVNEDKLSYGHARCLVTIDDEEYAIELANRVVKEGMSVRGLENLLKEKPNKPKKEVVKDPNLENVRNIMERRFGTSIEVSKHKISISYKDTNDLNRILEMMDCLED